MSRCQDPSDLLLAALDRSVASARRRSHWLRHPIRHARPLVGQLTGPGEIDATLFTGDHLRVVIPEIVGDALYRYGHIEAPVSCVLLEWLRPGMVFFDVGAHYGYYPRLAQRIVHPGGAIVAFEPARGTYDLLRQNLAAGAAVRVENIAVGAREGVMELRDYGPRHSALNTLAGGARVPPAERRRLRAQTYDVAVTTLDQYAASTGLVPDVVKLDAEGAELAILHGMAGLLRDRAPRIVLETGDYEGMASPATEASIERLEGFGYGAYEYSEAGLRPHRRRSRYGYGNIFFVAEGAA